MGLVEASFAGAILGVWVCGFCFSDGGTFENLAFVLLYAVTVIFRL